ncbi:MAG: endolytic transglycosylase MltG [Bacteroidales bacterium]|nr:endolytic transglycosylase MltG [Bacteroidales bacterium]
MKLLQAYRKTVLRTFLLVAILALLAIGGMAFMCLNATTSNTESVRLYLPTDDNALAARDTLVANGLVDDGPLFDLMARTLKLDGWKPGSYLVEPHTPVFRLIKRLTRGQQDPIRLTIGKFRLPQQLNEYLDSKLMHNDFDIPLDSFHIIRPNTYEFYWTVTPEHFRQRMEKQWKSESEKWETEGGMLSTLRSPLSTRDIVVLASIVEEETNNNAEKPLIASVYLNRLKRGMPLQADPTVKYAVGDFALRRILNKHLATESPFNTYLHTGLPPAPICLPSESSVNAVVNAPQTDYIYFCASDKMDGTHRFAATLQEHQRNADAFHRALNQRGIK